MYSANGNYKENNMEHFRGIRMPLPIDFLQEHRRLQEQHISKEKEKEKNYIGNNNTLIDNIEASYNMYANLDAGGNDLTKRALKTATIEQCGSVCTTTENCNGFTYRPSDRSCFIKSSINTNNINKNINLMTWEKKPRHEIDIKYKFESQTDYSGNDLSESNKSIPECIMECNKNKNCVGIVHAGNENICWVKNKLDNKSTDTDYIRNRELNTFIKNYNKNYQQLPHYDFTPGVALWDHTMKPIEKNNIKACLDKCDTLPDCKAVGYSSNNKECFFKENISSGIMDTNMYTFKKVSNDSQIPNDELTEYRPPAVRDTQNILNLELYTDYGGNDLPNMPINNISLNDCNNLCSKETDCVGGVHYSKINQCWLKNKLENKTINNPHNITHSVNTFRKR